MITVEEYHKALDIINQYADALNVVENYYKQELDNIKMLQLEFTDENTGKLFAVVCEVCGCSKDDILSCSRQENHVIARKIISAMNPDISTNEVGRLLNRTHATIIHYRNNLESDLSGYALFKQYYNTVLNILIQWKKV